MKVTDIVKLSLAGKSSEEIKQLIELEDDLKNKDQEPAPAPAPDPEPEKVEDPEPEKVPDENEKKIEDLQKQLEDLQKKLDDAQKANTRKDVSGDAKTGTEDQDQFNDWVSSYM